MVIWFQVFQSNTNYFQTHLFYLGVVGLVKAPLMGQIDLFENY